MSAHTPGPMAAAFDQLRVELRDEKLLVVDLLAAVIALRAVAFHSSHCPAFPPGCADEPCRCGYDDAEQAAHEAVLKATGRSEAASPAARASIAKAVTR